MNRPILLTHLFVLVSGILAPGWAQDRCESSDWPEWTKNTYERVVRHDVLAAYAIRQFGEPMKCSGEVTATFDGNEFGSLRIEFGGGQVFQVDTFPPESSSATLTDSTGFKNPDESVETLRRYAAGIGLEIDWSDPVEAIEPPYRTVTFRDPDDGLNASTRLVYADSTLISVGLSLAL